MTHSLCIGPENEMQNIVNLNNGGQVGARMVVRSNASNRWIKRERMGPEFETALRQQFFHSLDCGRRTIRIAVHRSTDDSQERSR